MRFATFAGNCEAIAIPGPGAALSWPAAVPQPAPGPTAGRPWSRAGGPGGRGPLVNSRPAFRGGITGSLSYRQSLCARSLAGARRPAPRPGAELAGD